MGSRVPRDRSEYTRMDHHIDSMIQDSQLETLVSFAQEHPTRVGDMLGNYRLVLAQWEERDPDLIRKLLTITWNRLDMETRRQFIRLMIRMIYRVSKISVSKTGQQTGDVTISPFDFQGDDIALDRTLEQLASESTLSYQSIFVWDRRRRKRAAVLMIDASGSMQGESLSMAAASAASLAMNLDYRDEYSIVLFSEKAHVLKRMEQSLHLDQVICNLLNMLPEGRTNIGLGLSVGLKEIERSRVEQRMGILLTDGWQNVGQDPLGLAGRFPKLHVISLPGGNPELAERIARAGRGRYIALREMLNVPTAVSACLE